MGYPQGHHLRTTHGKKEEERRNWKGRGGEGKGEEERKKGKEEGGREGGRKERLKLFIFTVISSLQNHFFVKSLNIYKSRII